MAWEDFKKLMERYGIDPVDPEDAEEDEAETTDVWVIAQGADPPPNRPADPTRLDVRCACSIKLKTGV